MPYIIQKHGKSIGEINDAGITSYSDVKVSEQIAGKQGKVSGSGFVSTSVSVVYKFDSNRTKNNDAIYELWKNNGIVSNRVNQLNALVFGRGFGYQYDNATKEIIDRFWRLNRVRQKLDALGTDSQLYGEVFVGLFPQKNGDVLMCIYEANQVNIDFNPANVDDVNMYYVEYKNEETGQNEQVKFLPAYKYLNDIEFTDSTIGRAVKKVRRALNAGVTKIQGADGVMCHIKFNNSSGEVYGTSDFRQGYAPINEYIDFRADRLAIHNLYGSPSYDISIDTDDKDVIDKRIEELEGFELGSNPVHNANETWKPLEFSGGNIDQVEHDEEAMKGLISASLQFPQHLLFNQGKECDGGVFALNKLAENRQDKFGDMFTEIHKFVVSVAGGDISKVEEGQMIFPEISTMTEKSKAETYVLKVGAQICSRETAALNTGHSWDIEHERLLMEQEEFGIGAETVGRASGYFTTRAHNQDPDRDTGEDDVRDRLTGTKVRRTVYGAPETGNEE